MSVLKKFNSGWIKRVQRQAARIPRREILKLVEELRPFFARRKILQEKVRFSILLSQYTAGCFAILSSLTALLKDDGFTPQAEPLNLLARFESSVPELVHAETAKRFAHPSVAIPVKEIIAAGGGEALKLSRTVNKVKKGKPVARGHVVHIHRLINTWRLARVRELRSLYNKHELPAEDVGKQLTQINQDIEQFRKTPGFAKAIRILKKEEETESCCQT